MLVLPWLNPYTAGPTPNAWPWLFSAACAVILWLFQRKLDGRLIASGWILAASLSALVGLLQYFGLAPDFNPWISQTQAGEAFGNLRQRNQLATLMSIGLVALIALLALPKGPGREMAGRRGMPWWALASALLLAVGNAASGSRTGLLQWLLIPALTAWWVLPGGRRLLVFALQALLAFGVAVMMLPWLLELLTGVQIGGLFGRLTEAPTCESRKILWSNVLTLIAEKPWLGWGWGELDYAHFITLYSGPRFCEILDNAHNLPLHLAVELGLPAAVAICGALSWLVWRARPWAETDAARQMAWGVLAVILLHSLLEYPLWYGPFQLAAGLSAGLLWARRPPGAGFSPEIGQNRPVVQYFRLCIAIFMIATLATVAVSYYRVSQIYLPPAERSAAYQGDTLAKIRNSALFPHQAEFAELSMTALTPETAATLHALALGLLHYSPEPRVIEKLIESAVMLGRDDEALQYLARYRAAFPLEHARWASQNAAH
ncbi:Wzy polymerase domain-containing protein [Polaromonas sp.]|uniref:PglL family O-oligosaccharyltransferase n=1 Tax=Polaromonas sp. TaxID=1869339 RepID=UPI0025D036BE|nr:Wzy polymerase domain-containing protein [Polaromonas sp.]